MGCAKKMEFDFRLLSRLMARQGEQLAYHGDNRKLCLTKTTIRA